MSDNQHVEEALDNIRGAEEVTGHEPEDRAIFALTAQAHATLALAYEQRTANLIAAMQPIVQPDGEAIGLTVTKLAEMQREILERLGL